ncbi:CBS domain-containing protein [Aminivibrio sp.]|uniref:CBS domain-containing protein n=1 Tax=Aminivibrio sp. TaxID=1872489 RepID=UPI00168E7EB3|nr:CBS domain-containing protein [Synergistaceae bacterium]MDD4611651.1 CBS domain-containing protein [Synergistaceae bacterium]NLO57756.1 CBS domain-containing protein [Synergistaceae bacterium]
MRVITSHMGNDFDSLASMVAAEKLYPGARLCLSGSASRTVRDFLKKTGNKWTVLTPKKIKFDEITMLIVVDARSRSRIGAFASVLGKKNIPVHVYDHHPPSIDDIDGELVRIEPVGATTTLLVETLLERRISISPSEATLFATGIYEDTGGLTFSGTTPRDFAAVARMKELGADLTSIPTYIEMTFSAPERRILDGLIENSWVRFINGAKAVFSAVSSPGYVDGLSLFVHRLRDYFDADIAIAAVKMDSRTYLIGRSHDDILNMATFLAPLGGGGHPQAASVTLHNVKPLQLVREMELRLSDEVKPSITAADIMTSPVMAIPPDSSVDDAYRIMIRYGHSALPVVKGKSILGLITRKDLDKAHLHGFGKTLIREFMTEGVITIPKDASIHEAHRLLVTHSIGRLPVTEGSRIVGIITRTDLVKALFPASVPGEDRGAAPDLPWTEDVRDLLKKGLPEEAITLLRQLGERAEQLGMRAYIVGGLVRDLFLSKQNLDLDIVVEGDAPRFLKSWEKDGLRVSVHERYKTGTVVFPGGRKVDVATARREFYEFPVAQPKVSTDSLKHDLYRRDFTVNAMAVSINQSTWGILIDYFGGRRDLGKKFLKVLHNLSFVEDPTRVIRGIRLEQRLGLTLEDNTLRLLRSCIHGGLLVRLSGFRLRSEMELSFRERLPYPATKRMEELGVWEVLFPGIRIGDGSRKTFRRLGVFLARISRDFPDFKGKQWLAFLAALLMESPENVRLAAIDRLNLPEAERSVVVKCFSEMGAVEHELGGRSGPLNSRIYCYLRDFDPAASLFWSAATERWRVRRRILLYLTKLHKMTPRLRGRDLLDLGYSATPRIGVILDKLKLLCLDGELAGREDEIDFVTNQFPK